MIRLKTLKFSNIFSYGKNNEIELSANQITQILGINGAGKSSIPLIIEEVLFNKNSKGVKRSEVLNRFSKDKKYFISVQFEKISEIGTENYLIETSRGTTQSVKLLKLTDGNYEDLSSHTSTATYKQIENLLGFSHETFISLIYQSSAQSMGFLTATDTVRKRFLIELLGLTKYTEAFESFKEVAKEVSNQVLEIETKINTIQKWLDKNSLITNLQEEDLLETIDEPRDLIEEVAKVSIELKNIEETNKLINKNSQYKKILDGIELVLISKVPEDNISLIKERSNLEACKKAAELEVKKAKELKDTCPTCKQAVDVSFVPKLIEEKEAIIKIASEKIEQLQKTLDMIAQETEEYKKAEKNKQEFETYSALYNSKMSNVLLDKQELTNKIELFNKNIARIQQKIREITDINNKISAKNAQIHVIKEQSTTMQADLDSLSKELDKLSTRLATLEILKKAFSTNGLLAYKIECLVKDLEDITNEYLTELSSGRFQLTFKINNDKLNIIITDNGSDIEIGALSNGEKARVNTATLLAIRKIMQALSSTKINLLVLDETIDSLDIDGKEKLIEVLLNEVDLNTFLISHGYTHPLLEKLNVVKENNISRIE